MAGGLFVVVSGPVGALPHLDDDVATQTSARHGVLKVADRGDRVNITGQAVTVLVGTLMPSACPAATGPASGAGVGAGAGAEA